MQIYLNPISKIYTKVREFYYNCNLFYHCCEFYEVCSSLKLLFFLFLFFNIILLSRQYKIRLKAEDFELLLAFFSYISDTYSYAIWVYRSNIRSLPRITSLYLSLSLSLYVCVSLCISFFHPLSLYTYITIYNFIFAHPTRIIINLAVWISDEMFVRRHFSFLGIFLFALFYHRKFTIYGNEKKKEKDASLRFQYDIFFSQVFPLSLM